MRSQVDDLGGQIACGQLGDLFLKAGDFPFTNLDLFAETVGGKRGDLFVVAHFVNAWGELRES
jgi:hypothetical protein